MLRHCYSLAILALCVLPACAQDGALLDDPEDAVAQAEQQLAQYEKAETDPDKRWKLAVEHRVAVLRDLIATRESAARLEEETPDADGLARRKEQAEADLQRARALTVPDTIRLRDVAESAPYLAAHKDAQEKRDAALAAQTRANARIAAAAEEQQSLSDDETAVNKRLAGLTSDDELTRYRVATANVELSAIAERGRLQKRTVTVLSALLPVMQIELDAAERFFEHEEKRVGLARAEVTRLRKAESDEIRAAAEREARAAELAADPIARFRAQYEAQVTARRGAVKDLQIANAELAALAASYERDLKELRLEHGQLTERLEIDDEGAAALLSRMSQRNRRDLQLLEARAEEIAADTGTNQRALINLLDTMFELQLEVQRNPLAEALVEQVPERAEEARQAFREARGPLLEAMRLERTERETGARAYQSIALTIARTEGLLKEIHAFVQERIYWVRSDEPVGRATFVATARELRRIPEHFDRINEGFGDALAQQPAESALKAFLILLLCAAILFVPGILKRRAAARGAPAAEDEATGWRLVLRRTLGAVTRAALPALALLAIGWLLRRLHPEQAMNMAVPKLLHEIAFYVFLWKLSANLLLSDGVAVQLMRMRPDIARQIHVSVRLVAIAGVFFEGPAVVLQGAPFHGEAFPRLLQTVSLLLFATCLVLVVRPRGPLALHLTRPVGWLRRIWFFAGPLLILVFAAAVVMDVLGYRLGAEFVVINALQTAGGLFALVALYKALLKGVESVANVVRRRTMKEEGATAAWESWEQVRGQLTRVVATLVLGISVVALVHGWGAQHLMLGHIDEIKLIELQPDQWLTLWDLIVAVLWVAAGHFLVHNLSALYEFVVVPLAGRGTRGGRYVALTFARYGVLVIAYGAALVTVGFDYSKLGWIATALSVGIGFGLQEIVANFISGLILLVERPIAVGEAVTVGTNEGTVEKISMRATTVINWDKQTIIIPNKDFITKDLTNWTRNDNLMRRKISICVAHGSSVTRVMEILGDLARAHPKVLATPPPRTFFTGIGESGLDFELWAYTRVDDGLTARSELYVQVYEALEREGIEISIPRRSLSFRAGGSPADQDSGHPQGTLLPDDGDGDGTP